MKEKYLFEYAVIRVVPRVEREEFLNVGVILYCAGQRFLDLRFQLDKQRLENFCASCELPEIEMHLTAFERICRGGEDAGAIGKLPVAERFRWLTATRSTVVQTSKVHPGFCDDAAVMLGKLLNQLVD
jgi:hypothetical protein